MQVAQSLASDYVRLLNERGVVEALLLSANQVTDWDTPIEVLGWNVDPNVFTVTLPPHNRLKPRSLLAEGTLSRAFGSGNQV